MSLNLTEPSKEKFLTEMVTSQTTLWALSSKKSENKIHIASVV